MSSLYLTESRVWICQEGCYVLRKQNPRNARTSFIFKHWKSKLVFDGNHLVGFIINGLKFILKISFDYYLLVIKSFFFFLSTINWFRWRLQPLSTMIYKTKPRNFMLCQSSPLLAAPVKRRIISTSIQSTKKSVLEGDLIPLF
jgi:hypothetical protein